MKIRTNLLLFIFSVFAVSFCDAQASGTFNPSPGNARFNDNPFRNSYNNSFFFSLQGAFNKPDSKNLVDLRTVEGSPYFEDFQKGEFIQDDIVYGPFFGRYNIYNDEVEVKMGDDDELKSFSKMVGSKVNLENAVLEYHNFTDLKGNEKQGYLILAKELQNVNLYIKKECKYSPFKKAPNPQVRDVPARFNIYDHFYVLEKGNTKLKALPKKKKALLKLFPGMEKDISKYIKSKKLSLKKEQDLIKLIYYINTLYTS